MQLGSRHLADYGATRSRHDFTQRQLMACLILRAYTKTTYLEVIEFLSVSPSMRRELDCRKHDHLAKNQGVLRISGVIAFDRSASLIDIQQDFIKSLATSLLTARACGLLILRTIFQAIKPVGEAIYAKCPFSCHGGCGVRPFHHR